MNESGGDAPRVRGMRHPGDGPHRRPSLPLSRRPVFTTRRVLDSRMCVAGAGAMAPSLRRRSLWRPTPPSLPRFAAKIMLRTAVPGGKHAPAARAAKRPGQQEVRRPLRDNRSKMRSTRRQPARWGARAPRLWPTSVPACAAPASRPRLRPSRASSRRRSPTMRSGGSRVWPARGWCEGSGGRASTETSAGERRPSFRRASAPSTVPRDTTGPGADAAAPPPPRGRLGSEWRTPSPPASTLRPPAGLASVAEVGQRPGRTK